MTYVLGIESSCDETAASVVADGRRILSNVVASQSELHNEYGGVFPEMASRQHMVAITPVVREALTLAELDWDDLDALAVVYGPGLSGSLLVGMNAAKALAYARGISLVGVNHMESHIYANWLVSGDDEAEFVPPPFPLVCLIVSGGHSELIYMHEHHRYTRLGGTIDDAAGEAFDKVARLLGLGYPGGPEIDALARDGDPEAFDFPRALKVGAYDFSFSGLKTAVLRTVQDLQRERGIEVEVEGQKLADASLPSVEQGFPLADLAASFQAAVVDALVKKTAAAVAEYEVSEVLMAGGVAANSRLRRLMSERLSVPLRYPPIRLCTDNAAMVAAAGYYRFLDGRRSTLDLDVVPGLALV